MYIKGASSIDDHLKIVWKSITWEKGYFNLKDRKLTLKKNVVKNISTHRKVYYIMSNSRMSGRAAMLIDHNFRLE